MAINFDALPGSNPSGAVVPNGTYYGTIKNPEMRVPKPKEDGSIGKPYLNFKLLLQNAKSEAVGSIYDMLSDSDHEIPRYKIRRFIEALALPITGAFELRDLAKIIDGKRLIVDIAEDKRSTTPKSQVDTFSGDIYYPISEAANIFGNTAGVTGQDATPDTPFVVSDTPQTPSEY